MDSVCVAHAPAAAQPDAVLDDTLRAFGALSNVEALVLSPNTIQATTHAAMLAANCHPDSVRVATAPNTRTRTS
jgi:hypothetical protein